MNSSWVLKKHFLADKVLSEVKTDESRRHLEYPTKVRHSLFLEELSSVITVTAEQVDSRSLIFTFIFFLFLKELGIQK